MKDRITSFNQYLQNIFGERIQRVSLHAGFTCPNLDGSLSSGGCLYCNNKAFSKFSRQPKDLQAQIKDSIAYYRQHRGINKFIAYFQSFTNTYADSYTLRKNYEVIRKFPEVVGLFISTRPDCIDKEKIKLIAEYQKDYLVWLEYGLQTTHDHLLRLIKRNHTYQDFLGAYELTRRQGINLGVHYIVGLPTATYREIMADAKRLAKLDIQGIKFHVLHVLRGTELEKIQAEGNFKFLDQNDYVKIICDFLERIPSSVVILRLVSDAHPDYLIGPSWINNKANVIAAIKNEFVLRGTRQGYNYENSCSKN